jgi:hypothetical protein
MRLTANQLRKAVDALSSCGYIGGVSSLVFGLLGFVYNLRLWNLWKGTGLPDLFENTSKSNVTYVSFMFIAAGVAILFDRSSLHFSSLVRRIKKAEERGRVSAEAANVARTIILSKTLGEDINVVDIAFKEFVQWIRASKGGQGQDIANQTEQLWRTYRRKKPQVP